MGTRRLLDITPPLIVFILMAAILGLVFELVVGSARHEPVDPIATTVLGGLVGACITALGPLWLASSQRRPPTEPPAKGQTVEVEPSDPDSNEWNRDGGYFNCREGGRWTLCSTG